MPYNKNNKEKNSSNKFEKSKANNSAYKKERSAYQGNNQRLKTHDNKPDFKKTESYTNYVKNRQDDFDDAQDKGYIIGRNPVIEALKAKQTIDTIYVNSEGGGSLGLICKMAREQGIVVKQVNDIKLDAMANGASHQGVIASGACAEYVTIEEIMAISKEKDKPAFIIICDEIEDPHNLGAIIRTAEAAGADGIIIPKRRSASLNRTVYKTSAGAASWLPVARVPNIPTAIETLQKNGIWVYGTDAKGEDYTKTDMTGNVALVIGSEGFGMGRLIEEKCDFLVKLPMNGKITSLNASVAAGIFMYETVRQRMIKN